MAAISITNSTGCTIDNVRIIGADVGIRVRNSSGLNFRNVGFKDVRQAWDIDESPTEIRGSRISRSNGAENIDILEGSRTFVGYTPAKGGALPSICPACNTVFPSRHYRVGSSAFYGFDNEDICPKCGNEHAKLAEGSFDLSGEVVRVLQAEPLTFAMLAAIANIAEDIATSKLSPHDGAERIKEISPGIGALFSRAAAPETWSGWVGVFIVVLQQCLASLSGAASPDSCTIVEEVQKHDRRVQYTLNVAVENCLSRIGDTIIFKEDSVSKATSSDKKVNEESKVREDAARNEEGGKEKTSNMMPVPLPLPDPRSHHP